MAFKPADLSEFHPPWAHAGSPPDAAITGNKTTSTEIVIADLAYPHVMSGEVSEAGVSR